MKNIDLKQFKTLIYKLLSLLSKYLNFLFLITVLLIYTFLVLRISTLSKQEPSEDAVLEKANTVKRLKLDQAEIDKIQQLEDRNIGVQSLFDSARDNPFQD